MPTEEVTEEVIEEVTPEVTPEVTEEVEVIEGEIVDGEARAINLATSFDNQVGTHYTYKIEDKVAQDTLPPSKILIEKLPANGKIYTTDHDGTVRELEVGEVIETEMMKNFQYQGDVPCVAGESKGCEDAFSYSTMSSWVGTGYEAESEINLTPMQV